MELEKNEQALAAVENQVTFTTPRSESKDINVYDRFKQQINVQTGEEKLDLAEVTLAEGDDHAKAPKVPPKVTFTTVPPEILNDILSRLEVNDSVCLGLTCTLFYKTHFTAHGPIRLLLYDYDPNECLYRTDLLCWRIEAWMENTGYELKRCRRAFVRKGL